MRRKPARVEMETRIAQFGQHIVKVFVDPVRQHEPVVQFCAPTRHGCRIGLVPKAGDQRTQQELLHDAHAGMGRHLEGAQLQQTQAPGRGVGRVHLVNAELAAVGVAGHVHQNVAQGPVDHPGGHVGAQLLPVFNDLAQGDFQLIDLVIARFVHARGLAGRADEHAAEQIAQAWVVVPVKDQAGQQLGAAQERAVVGCGTAQHEVVATTRAGVAAIGHELFSRQAGFKRSLV